MKFNDLLTDDSIVGEINRICGSNATTYTNKAKAARLNAALDRYLHLAFESDGRWSFDDINNASPPLDTQNIVSGTNRYKFSAFTEKILSLIKLEILNSAGTGVVLIPETIDAMGGQSVGAASGVISGGSLSCNFEDLYISPDSGTPTHYLKYGDFIYLRPSPNYSKTAGLKAYFNRPASKFIFVIFTVTIASPGVFTATAHGLALNDTVIFNTDGALPTGLTADTTYYVITAGLTADAFEVSTTQGGSAVNTSGSQSGNHSFLKTNKEPGVPSIHHTYLARYASLPYLIENSASQTVAVAQEIQADELAIKSFFSRRSKDDRARLSPRFQNNR